MTNFLRPAVFIGAVLAATTLAPAHAELAGGGVQPKMASAHLPKVATPDLLANEVEPALSGDVQPNTIPRANVVETPFEPVTAEAAPSGDLTSLVSQLSQSEAGSRELECLATGIYYESKSEPLSGQLAVGHVIANRSKSGRFPASYCGVLFQRGQFSFIRGKSLPGAPRASKQWKTAVAMARIVHQGLKDSAVGNALFFHARRVSPGWRLKRVASIGNHVFYR